MNTRCQPHSKESEKLLAWYDANARVMPWRIGPEETRVGIKANPYPVWLSEIMLQQTQVNTVEGYFRKFIKKWPTLGELAAAELEDVLKAWAGLGYYSRARNLKKCADILYRDYGGKFPNTAAELARLPGIGPYTSAAISAIAFGEKIAVIDGNVERVMARRHAIAVPVRAAKTEIRELVTRLVPASRPGDFAQAMMDLGATLCTPRAPLCSKCPLARECEAFAHSRQQDFPVKAVVKIKPVRKGAAFVAVNAREEILLRKRNSTGLLAGMSEVPSSDWSSTQDGETGAGAAPFSADWQAIGIIRHTFTHFHLEMKAYVCMVDEPVATEGWWVARESVMDEALPTLMKKIVALALKKQTEE